MDPTDFHPPIPENPAESNTSIEQSRDAQSPSALRPYRYGGWGLLALATVYFVSCWFTFIGLVHNSATANIAFFFVILEFLGLLLLDWQGFTSFCGRATWSKLSTAQKFWLVCGFFCVPEIMAIVYFRFAIGDYYRATQQNPMTQARTLYQRYKASPKKNQGVVASSLITGVIVFFVLSGLALASGVPGGTDASSLDANSNGGGASTSLSTPTPTSGSTHTPSPTMTPAPTKVPTATPKPKQWVTVKTFSGNGVSKTGTFTENASQWKITWTCNPQAYGSEYNLIADLTIPGQDFGDPVVNVICKVGDASTTHGETMEYTQGTFYLSVTSESSWTFEIQEYK